MKRLRILSAWILELLDFRVAFLYCERTLPALGDHKKRLFHGHRLSSLKKTAKEAKKKEDRMGLLIIIWV